MKNKINKIVLITSMLLSFLFFTGYSISKTGTIDYLFTKNFILFITLFFLMTFALYFILFFLYKYIDKQKKDNKIVNFCYHYLFEIKPFLIPFLIFILFGLPMVIFFYPGMVQWDGFVELDYFYGIIPWSTHHPILPTLVMGICVKIGRFLSNDNFGAFIFNFPQFIFSCITYSYCLFYLTKIKAPKTFILISFLFLLFNPVLYFTSYTLFKDNYYSIFSILFLIEFINYYNNKDNNAKLLIFSLLVVLFRKNGIYVVITSLICMLFFNKSKRNITFKIICLIVISYISIFKITTFAGIEQGNIREALSIPIQQTGRYIKTYKLTNDEKQFYEYIFDTDINTIKKNYEPELSDPIKDTFYIKNSNDFINYFKFWFKGLKKHPKIYFDAFLENTYGYFYPFKREYAFTIANFNIERNNNVNTGYFNFNMDINYGEQRYQIVNNIYKARNNKVIGLMFNTGVYTWVLIVTLGYVLYKKNYSNLVISIPILMNLLFCFLSPLNAHLRYMNPVIFSLPVFVGFCIKKKDDF